MSPRLRFRDTIDRGAAEEMLHAFVACGENSTRTFFWSPQQVVDLFGHRYDGVVESLRRGETLPEYENLLGSTFQVVAPGSFVTLRLAPAGDEVRVEQAGVLTLSDYAAKFEAAVQARDSAVDRQSLTDFDTAAYHGIAAIETYLNWQADAWDQFHPHAPIFRKRYRMSLDEKIDRWLPTLATGSWLDYRAISWESFFEFKKLRNRRTHSRKAGSGVALSELARRLNLFVRGVAAPLMQLHQVFHERIPSPIIRATYSPDIYVAEE